MALGSSVNAQTDPMPLRAENMVITTPPRAPWVTIIDNGGLETQDAADITDPAAEINNSTTHILRTGGRGTKVYFRMKYDDGITPNADPVLKVFGRYDSDSQWEALYMNNATPTHEMTMVTAEATDVTDGTDIWTPLVAAGNTEFDLLGNDEVLVGVETAFTVTGGDATLTTLEAKVV